MKAILHYQDGATLEREVRIDANPYYLIPEDTSPPIKVGTPWEEMPECSFRYRVFCRRIPRVDDGAYHYFEERT